MKVPRSALAPLRLMLHLLGFAHRNLPWVIALILLTVVMGGGLSGYFFHMLRKAQQKLTFTELRLAEAEQRNQGTENRLQQAESQILQALASLETERARTRDQLTTLTSERVRQNLRRDEAARQEMETLRHEMQAQLDQMRRREEALMASLSGRPGQGKGNRDLKAVFLAARPAILYLRVDYRVRVASTGEEQTMTGFGTGFFISPSGVALSAQHVIFPWRYDKTVRAALDAGLVELVPDSHAVAAWLVERRVIGEDASGEDYLLNNAYRLDRTHRQLRLLHVGRTRNVEQLVTTPLGLFEVSLPGLVEGDVVVFQVLDEGRRFPHLKLAPRGRRVAALDEVMVVGYPLSRLQDGAAIPQPSMGRVRRAGQAMIELDSPLHPGNSGGPILDRQGQVIGLASAVLDSPVYGVAVSLPALHAAWAETRATVRAEQLQLKAAGCDPGAIDGIPGLRTLRALRCAGR